MVVVTVLLRPQYGSGKEERISEAKALNWAELLDGGIVYTVDEKDFSVYRKHGRQAIPFICPQRPST